jgi:predicted ABC-type ATPase
LKDIVLLGGPNGAGKTTAARVLIPEYFKLRSFMNADEIARDLSPSNVEAAALAAGRIMIERMRAEVRAGESFAIETTLAGKSYIPMLRECKANGWRIVLFYFWLLTPEDSIARVARRVSEGGHHIPDEVIYRRCKTGLWNMRNLYLPLADDAEIYDNTGREPVLIAEKREGLALLVHDPERWEKMEEAIG